jgi:hypothetical protein
MEYKFQDNKHAYFVIYRFCECGNCEYCPLGAIALRYGKEWHCVRLYEEALRYLDCEDLIGNDNLYKVLIEVGRRVGKTTSDRETKEQ